MNTKIDPILEQYQGEGRDKLIPMLQDVQESQGYLSKEAIVSIGEQLNIAATEIYGVATFYNQFRFEPKGKYHVMLCRGTACHVKGSGKVLEKVSDLLKIAPGETTRDGLFSLEVVACMGACGLAPVININGDFHAKVTPAKAAKIIEQCRNEESTNNDADE